MKKEEFIDKGVTSTTNNQNNDFKNNLTLDKKIEYLTNIIIEADNNLESKKNKLNLKKSNYKK